MKKYIQPTIHLIALEMDAMLASSPIVGISEKAATEAACTQGGSDDVSSMIWND